MPTESLEDVVVEMAGSDPEFRRELLVGAVEAVANGELFDARLHLASVVAAGVGYDSAAEGTGLDADFLRQNLTAEGEVNAEQFARLIDFLKDTEQVRFHVSSQTPDGSAVDGRDGGERDAAA